MIGPTFLAVRVPEPAGTRLAQALRHHDIPGRLVPQENWHITLRFLGTTTRPACERICSFLDEADLGAPFKVELTGIGAFPSTKKATVVWKGVGVGADRIRELAMICDDIAQAAGFAPEDRPVRPHVTLSRIRPPRDVAYLLDGSSWPKVGFRAESVTFYHSVLGDGPARYEEIERFSFRR